MPSSPTTLLTYSPISMTMVSPNLCLSYRQTKTAGLLRWALLVGVASSSMARAQQPPAHWLHAGAMPPGAIGSQRLMRGGPLSGYFQPVQIRAPEGARISLAEEAGFSKTDSNRILVGMQIGPVYRLKVTSFPPDLTQEVFPTIEIIDRLYPPAELALRYPIPIELTADELEMASQGMFVTRIIYLENPNEALPVEQQNDEQQWVEVPRGADPLVVADEMGRPVAILRIGGRHPSPNSTTFDFCPPLIRYNTF